MHFIQNQKIDSVDTADAQRDATRAALSIAVFTDDPVTARAVLHACEGMHSFDCRVRIALRDDQADAAGRPDEVVIYDVANADDRRVDPARFAASPRIALVHDWTGVAPSPDATRPVGLIHFVGLSPTTLEAAVRSALAAHEALGVARTAQAAADRRADRAHEARARQLDEVAAIAHALDGVLDLMGAGAGKATGHFGLVRNWTRDLVALVERGRRSLAQSRAGRADLGRAVDAALRALEKECAARRQSIVLCPPPQELIAAIDEAALADAAHRLLAAVFEREGGERRFDIVLWRSLDECRLAIIAGPVRRAPDASTAPIRLADAADARLAGAIAAIEDLGGRVDVTSSGASGATAVVALPIAADR